MFPEASLVAVSALSAAEAFTAFPAKSHVSAKETLLVALLDLSPAYIVPSFAIAISP